MLPTNKMHHQIKHYVGLILVIVFGVVSALGSGGGGGGGDDDDGGVTPPENNTPVANAGHDVRTTLNSTVVLDGSLSSDEDDDPLTYLWSMVSFPAGSSASLLNPTNIKASFIADEVGEYLITLVVNDGTDDSVEDTVIVTALSSQSNLSDANQDKCFDTLQEINCPSFGENYYGQDAQYSTNPIMLVDNGVTITDSTTGLEWQKEGESIYNWYQATGTADPAYNPSGATNVCGDLSLDSKLDWRLPTVRELFSLANYAFSQPTIDAAYFPDTTPTGSVYWSITENSSYTDSPWGVSYELGYVGGYAKGEGHYVRCVRGATWGINSFSDNGDGTTTDSMSGLIWQKNNDGVARSWDEALSYCENLILASSSEWRLPDIRELESTIAYNSSPYIDTTYFSFVGVPGYWSSTTLVPYIGTAYFINYQYGWLSLAEKVSQYQSVRCVR